MAKIYSPNESYTGVSASVQFQNGVGETEDKYLIEWFEKHGYKTEPKAIELEDEEEEPKAKRNRK